MYVCMYVCMYLYVCIDVSMYLCIYVSMYAYVRSYVCMLVCTIYLCMYVRMYVCMYVFMFVCMYGIYGSVTGPPATTWGWWLDVSPVTVRYPGLFPRRHVVSYNLTELGEPRKNEHAFSFHFNYKACLFPRSLSGIHAILYLLFFFEEPGSWLPLGWWQ